MRAAVSVLLFTQHCVIALWAKAWTLRGRSHVSRRSLLVFRVGALGDFLFSVPALAALRAKHPRATITLLTAPTTEQAQRAAVETYSGKGRLPWLEFVVPSVVDDAVVVESFQSRKVFATLRARLRQLRVDGVVILAHPGDPALGLLKKVIFLRLLGVRAEIYGWRTRASNRWLRQVQYDAGLFEHHVVASLRSICELPGMPNVDEISVSFPLSIAPEAQSRVDALWARHGLTHARVVAVAPGSIQPHKQWPMAKFVELCQALVGRYGVTIVVIGSPQDEGLGEELVERVDGAIANFAGQTSVVESAALLAKCVLLVGNDGGAMHLGAAMGRPVVSIVPGIEYPESVEPWGNMMLAVRHPVPCAPCYSFSQCPQGHNRCMEDVAVSDVLSKCDTVLAGEQ